MISKLLHWQTKGIGSAAIILAVSALATKGLGVLRDRLLASNFGAGSELDVYFAAFRIPDFLYAFLVLWGVSAVFVPLFSEYMAKNREYAWRFVSNLLNVYVFFLAACALAAAVFMPTLVGILAPGFEGSQKDLMIMLSRIMLLSPLLFAISSVFGGMLQYFQRFVAYALAPIMYNLGIIGGIVLFGERFGVFGVTMGVVAGACMHVLIQLPSVLSSGFTWKPLFSLDATLKKALLLSIPRTIAGVAHQANLMVMTALASLLPTGSIAVFTFADNLQNVPIGAIGIPLAVAAFPLLSQAVAGKNDADFVKTFFSALRKIFILVVPAACIVFFFRDGIVSLILDSGEFTQADVRLTASLLGVFSLGIIFQSVVPLLVRAFFALQNTVLPTIAGVSAIVLNIVLVSVFLRAGWGIVALPMAMIVSVAFQCLLLSLLLLVLLGRNHARQN